MFSGVFALDAIKTGEKQQNILEVSEPILAAGPLTVKCQCIGGDFSFPSRCVFLLAAYRIIVGYLRHITVILTIWLQKPRSWRGFPIEARSSVDLCHPVSSSLVTLLGCSPWGLLFIRWLCVTGLVLKLLTARDCKLVLLCATKPQAPPSASPVGREKLLEHTHRTTHKGFWVCAVPRRLACTPNHRQSCPERSAQPE